MADGDCLLILNPRRIDECVAALGSLPIDKLWVRNMSEPQIVTVWPHVLDRARMYDRLFLISDDALPRPFHLTMLQGLLDDGHPVVTGYSNLALNDFRVNLTKSPLGPISTPEAYDLYTLGEVMAWPTVEVPTTVTGFSLTGMSRSLWTRYPFRVEPETGAQSDFNLSKRLAVDGVPIVAHRDAFIWHVKEDWLGIDQAPRKQLRIGYEPPGMELEPWDGRA
jgi:hypothetical protein